MLRMLPHLLLVQAGPTDLDLQNRIAGRLDLPLSEQAVSSTEQALMQLGPIAVTSIISAPCQSAVQTAQMLAKSRRMRVKIDKRLVNVDFGLWHGKSLAELKQTQPDVYRRWTQHPERVQAPGGESAVQVQERLESFLAWCHWKFGSRRVAVVAPAGIAQRLAQLYFPCEPDESRFGDVSRVQWAWLPIGHRQVLAEAQSEPAEIDNFSPIWGL